MDSSHPHGIPPDGNAPEDVPAGGLGRLGHGESSDVLPLLCERWLREAWSEPVSAPATLDARVALELEEPALRLARAVRQLEPWAAPEALAAAVAEDLTAHARARADRAAAPALEAWERSTATAYALRELEPLRAPAVLERLVEEELRDPARARAARFVGSLPRESMPPGLESRLRAAGFAASRRWVAPLVLVAATVLLWVGMRWTRSDAPSGEGPVLGDAHKPRYSFRVETVDDPAQLGSTAESLLAAFAGWTRVDEDAGGGR